MIDICKGFQGERMLFVKELSILDESEPMTERQLKKAVEQIKAVLKLTDNPPREDVEKTLNACVNAPDHIRASRKRLIESGLAEEAVKGFPALQVVLLDEKVTYEAERDRFARWMPLPYPQSEAGIAREEAKKRPAGLLVGFVPATMKVRNANVRLEQRFAMLRVVEALRLHAAEHRAFPEKLADIQVPIPVDPVTGKPFLYKLEGKTAKLGGAAPRGMETNAAFNIRYELTMRK
jgi:hypothetical protein